MGCANWTITIFALIIIAVTQWPTMLGANASWWVVMVAAILVIITVWKGCNCKWCENMPKANKSIKKRRR